MKAITLWQPWASLCVEPDPFADMRGVREVVKPIETRSWKAPDSLIGQRIAIHAAARRPRLDETEPINEALDGIDFTDRVSHWAIARRVGPGEWFFERLPLGAVVGTAVLTDCVRMEAHWPDYPAERGDQVLAVDTMQIWRRAPVGLVDVWQPGPRLGHARPFGLFAPGRWAWLLADVERFETPVPAIGRQGFWNWEPTDG